MESRFLQPGQINLIGSRARDWLVGLQKLVDGHANATMRHALQILMGLWICERALLDDKAFSCTKSQLQNVCQCTASLEDGFTALLHADPPLVLLSTGILRFFNFQNIQLELFAQEISHMLQEHADHSDEEANELFVTRFLLHSLHLHASLPSYRMREMPACDLIQADDMVTRSLVTGITAATQYGQIMLTTGKNFAQALHAILPILMVHYFGIYNLELGMDLLRCLHYLNLHENRSFYTGLNFLIAQQQQGGHFGFLARETSPLPISGNQFELDLNIYLPHTVSFLWTLAEITNPQFILANSFSR
jgi:hypothetical protein